MSRTPVPCTTHTCPPRSPPPGAPTCPCCVACACHTRVQDTHDRCIPEHIPMHLPIDALAYHTPHHTHTWALPCTPTCLLAPLHLCVPPHSPEMPATLSHSLHRGASRGITQRHVALQSIAWSTVGQGRLMQGMAADRSASCRVLWDIASHRKAPCGIVGRHAAS